MNTNDASLHIELTLQNLKRVPTKLPTLETNLQADLWNK